MATDLCQIAKNVAENVFCTDGINSYEEAWKIFFATFQDSCFSLISGRHVASLVHPKIIC